MIQDPHTLYKLIILYMLNRVSFPLTKSQVGDFVLEKEYTNFLTLQQVISELTLALLPPAPFETAHTWLSQRRGKKP